MMTSNKAACRTRQDRPGSEGAGCAGAGGNGLHRSPMCCVRSWSGWPTIRNCRSRSAPPLVGYVHVKIRTITEEQFWARKGALQVSDHAKAASGTLQPEETLMIPSRMLRDAVPQWPQDAFAECEVTFE